MTAPRYVVPGAVYLITRRCSERRFFLRPDAATTALFLYALAEAAQRFGMRLIAWLPMSNHYHAVVEDPNGDLPKFLCHFHKMAARSLNRRWGRAENLWAAEPASVVRLVEGEDVLDKTVYALVNPIAAHLVERLVDWPGGTSFQSDVRRAVARAVLVERPRTFYRSVGAMPRRVSLRAEAPTGWPGGPDAWFEAVRLRVEARVQALNDARRARGERIVGRRSLLRLAPNAKPKTMARRGGLRPELACLNKDRRIAELAALGRFRAAYARAREAFVAGLRAMFPFGTYKLVRELGAPSARRAAPPEAPSS